MCLNQNQDRIIALIYKEMVFKTKELNLHSEDKEDFNELIELGLVEGNIDEYTLSENGRAYANNKKGL